MVNRFELNKAAIDWADVIFTTGGDGTFLMAASRIVSSDKPLIGINSDPSRSVGYLCLPQPYSTDLEKTLDRLCSGNFEWSYRQRIRILIEGENAGDGPIELHNQQLLYPEYRYLELDHDNFKAIENSNVKSNSNSKLCTIPVRALNEVFVGESLSSRVSYYEFSINDQPKIKLKSSGLTICTGTGSTSWSFNINRLTSQSVKSLFEIYEKEAGIVMSLDDTLIQRITQRFNDSLIFSPSKPSMAYTVRDPVMFGVDMKNTRGFANKIEVRSRMFDATVVIDGGLSYKFNDGSFARFEICEEDKLKTICSL